MSEEEMKVDEQTGEVLEEAPKKRGRKRKDPEEAKKINGKIDNDSFIQAISDIQNDSMVPAEKVAEILNSAMSQAYLEWSYPGLFRDRDSNDPVKELVKADVVFENDYKKFKIFDIKTVVPDEEIIDDSYQISPEDAQEFSKKAIHVGDNIRIPFDVKKLDKKYVRRVKQLFLAKLKEASKSAIYSVYSTQIGGLIDGTVTHVDSDSKTYEVSFGKAQATLRRNNMLPQDSFEVGDRVTVYLSDVSDKMNPPSLVVSRSNEKFIEKLLERYVPELQTGEVKIKAIAREAGKRSKVFVESENPNLDPVGACVGPESSRIKSVNAEIKSEKIDILVYKKNKALQVVEAMKPAIVIGMTCPDDFFDPNVHYEEFENDREYEFPKITCVVTNGTQGVAIGTAGVNVRLASKITKCTISVLTAEQAITERLKYTLIQDIRKMAGEKDETEEVKPEDAIENVDSEEAREIDAQIDEDMKEAAKETAEVKTSEEKPAEVTPREEVKPEEKPVEEAKPEEPVKEEIKPEEVKPAPVEEKKPVEEAKPAEKPAEVKPEPVKEEEKIEHIEIKNKPKISLEELEQAISSKKGPSETRSRKKWKKEEKKAEEAPSMASQATAMPIYTDEELKAMEEEEQNDSEDYSDDIDLDEYEDDKYYEDK